MQCLKVHVVSDIVGLYQSTLARCEDLRGSVQFTGLDWKDADLSSKLKGADVVFGEPGTLSHHMPSLSAVKWVHSTFAGVEPFMRHPCPSFVLTRHGGTFGLHMSEYVIAQIVNKERKFFGIYDEQKRHEWCVARQQQFYRPLYKLTIGILGVGLIGKKSESFLRPILMDGLPELLSSCDYVCNLMPSTPETRGMLNGDMFKHCAKKKAVFINIGRGDVVDEASLVDAFRQGWLSGAVLDVVPEEPLPPDSALWSLPEVTITPHVAALSNPDELAEGFETNLRLFLEGKELRHIVDWNRGY